MLKANLLPIFLIAIFFVACGSDGNNTELGTDNSSADSIASTENEQPIEEAESSKKKELLASLIGEHSLESVSGFTGANTMMDYYIVDGKWTAGGSSNVGGMREGFDLELTDADIQKLSTAKIIVKEDLSVVYSCNGKTYFDIPFKEDGMEYLLDKPSENYYSALPENVDANSTFVNGILYLLAQNVAQEQLMNEIDIMQLMADAVVISYNQEAGEFSMSLFYAECCDNSIYTFK